MTFLPPSKLLALVRRWDLSYFYAFLGESTMAVMFLFYVIVARVMGPESYGVFTAAAALGGILGALIQYGLPVLLTRKVAEDPVAGTRSAGCYLLVQGINTLPVLMVLPLLTARLGFTREGAILCALMIFADLLRSAKMLWRGVMKGSGWFGMESVSVAIERFAVVLCALITLVLTKNLVLTVLALVLARFVDIVGLGLFLSRKVSLGRKIHAAAIRRAYRQGLPFAVHGILWLVYYQVDMVMLKAMSSETEVGYYGAAYRVMEILSALPRVIFYVAFTRFARCMAANPAQLPRKVLETTRVMLLVMLPPLVIAGYSQPWLMRWVFGTAYLPSILLLAVLLPGLAVKMFSTLSEEFLLATGYEKKLPALLLVVAVSNVGANYLLIPRLGALGAAIATTFSECVFCVLGMSLMIRNGLGKTGARIVQVMVPAILLGVAPTLMVAGLPPVWSMACGLSGLAWLLTALRSRNFFGHHA